MDDYLEFENDTKALKSINLDDFSIEELKKYIEQLKKEKQYFEARDERDKLLFDFINNTEWSSPDQADKIKRQYEEVIDVSKQINENEILKENITNVNQTKEEPKQDSAPKAELKKDKK